MESLRAVTTGAERPSRGFVKGGATAATAGDAICQIAGPGRRAIAVEEPRRALNLSRVEA